MFCEERCWRGADDESWGQTIRPSARIEPMIISGIRKWATVQNAGRPSRPETSAMSPGPMSLVLYVARKDDAETEAFGLPQGK